jgi:hypothetical protein
MTTSIFSKMSSLDLTNIDLVNSFQINLSNVEFTDIYVNPYGEALFAFVLPNNSICCIQMPALINNLISNAPGTNQNLPIKFEINQPNIVKRLWSGITRYLENFLLKMYIF